MPRRTPRFFRQSLSGIGRQVSNLSRRVTWLVGGLAVVLGGGQLVLGGAVYEIWDMGKRHTHAIKDIEQRLDIMSNLIANASALRSKVQHPDCAELQQFSATTFPPQPTSTPPSKLTGSPGNVVGTQDNWIDAMATGLTLSEARRVAKERSVWFSTSVNNEEFQRCNAVLWTATKLLTAAHCIDQAFMDDSFKVNKVRAAGATQPIKPPNLKSISIADPRAAALRQKASLPVEKRHKVALPEERDVALLEFESPLAFADAGLQPPELVKPDGDQAVAIFTQYRENNRFYGYSSKLETNAVDSEYSIYQGPGRTGHSGAGVFASNGGLIGVMSEADGPRSGVPDG